MALNTNDVQNLTSNLTNNAELSDTVKEFMLNDLNAALQAAWAETNEIRTLKQLIIASESLLKSSEATANLVERLKKLYESKSEELAAIRKDNESRLNQLQVLKPTLGTSADQLKAVMKEVATKLKNMEASAIPADTIAASNRMKDIARVSGELDYLKKLSKAKNFVEMLDADIAQAQNEADKPEPNLFEKARIRATIINNARKVAFGGTVGSLETGKKAIAGNGWTALIEAMQGANSLQSLRKALAKAVPDALKKATSSNSSSSSDSPEDESGNTDSQPKPFVDYTPEYTGKTLYKVALEMLSMVSKHLKPGSDAHLLGAIENCNKLLLEKATSEELNEMGTNTPSDKVA